MSNTKGKKMLDKRSLNYFEAPSPVRAWGSIGRGIHINSIENFWNFTKQRLAKFNGVKRYFDLYLTLNYLELQNSL